MMVNNREVKIRKIDRIIFELESLKKKSFSSNELRSRNGMMGRLERIREKEFSRKLTLQQNKLRDPVFLENFINQEQERDTDIFPFLHVPKKKNTIRKSGGFFGF